MKNKQIHNPTTFSLRTSAKLVRFPGGERKFAAWMRDQKFLMAKNEAYQEFIDKGWFLLGLATIYKANPNFQVPVTRITLKGISVIEKLVFDQFHKPQCP